MKLRFLASILGALAIAGSAFAQFTQDQKDQLLTEIGEVITQKAFVPGVDLAKWRSFVDERKDKMAEAESPREFAGVINAAFKEFGLSHIQLLPARGWRHGGGEVAAQGRFRSSRRPELSWIDDSAAVLRIPSFEVGYSINGVADLVQSAKDAKYLIVDLRGDPGGSVDNMRQFLGLLLPSESPIGTFVSRKMASDFGAAKGDAKDPVAIARWAKHEILTPASLSEPFKGKVAVLVDNRSASASEIVADALRESRKSPIIGSPTMGAVLVSTFGQLSYGFQIQFPVGDYVSHDGLRLEGHPLVPDLAADGSAAVDAALAKLKG